MVWSLMIVATCLLVARAMAIVGLACRNKKRTSGDEEPAFEPPVSVIVAAYNEEKVIANTLWDLLGSTYSGELEVLVIDDGSTDQTSDVVTDISNKDPRVRLLRQSNQGKALALQRGIQSASHDTLVMLDADTRFESGTIGRLVQPLGDPSVAAVSGHAMVGNPRTFMARCQSLEYLSAFNLDRRAFHELGCITVAPGAVSALRRDRVIEVGGISTDTLAEDTDLTLTLHKAGYRIVYAPKAVAWTEAPETMSALVKQRFRWAFGTLQCLWKHSDLLFSLQHKSLGWFCIPGIWVFQIFLVALAPFLDGLLVSSMLFGSGGPIFTYFLAFLTVDLLLVIAACLLERENLRQVWLILPMRFIYRGLLSWVIWKSLIKAAEGAWVGWAKLDRTASVPSRG
jgi:peptidoglycan-N-acetylglucosamine deacetylase